MKKRYCLRKDGTNENLIIIAKVRHFTKPGISFINVDSQTYFPKIQLKPSSCRFSFT
jgi:hypothetical protein